MGSKGTIKTKKSKVKSQKRGASGFKSQKCTISTVFTVVKAVFSLWLAL
jgi:hypothetical protein